MAFSKLKAHLRRLEARICNQLMQACGDICGPYEPDECWNSFKLPDMRHVKCKTL